MQPESTPSFFPYLCQRFESLVWSCLDSDLIKSAVFHAERYFAMDQQNHDARHLYATALLREGQTYSALCLVNIPREQQCTGCLELKAKCCTALGRHRQAREALERALLDLSYMPSSSSSTRVAPLYPDSAALHCRAGVEALKGNIPEKASSSFRRALALNPHLWEAFEGLCAIGSCPEIDDLFPPRPAPRKRSPPTDIPNKPVATGAGFFTPDAGGSGNLFSGWKPDPGPPALFRMGPLAGPRDSLISNESVPPLDNSFQVHRTTRSQLPGNIQTLPPRPLSSADEVGPVPKKLRSTVRQNEVIKPSKSTKMELNEPLKKARARPALIFANIFSSPGRRSQPTTSSKTGGAGKNANQLGNANPATRRSTRLLSGTATKAHPPKTRDRRRQPAQSRTRSMESDLDEEALTANELTHTPSPPSNAQSGSEGSPSTSNWTSAHEQAAQEEYDAELADYYLYNLTRRFASATRALAMYDSQKCLNELEQLPHAHQSTSWVLAMVGRAHYEKLDYASAERAFQAVRKLEPHRLWDMEVYSTLLWHLQRNIELSFLAQELLNINPRSSQAWIAIGNLFSLQKERSQALTCFRRAAQLDPTCAYAYTLSGHESIDEDLDKAISFFQSALRADPRHYNAWYGLGTCYLRMSKIRLAEYHYRKALEIHPNNAVLLGCVGMAVERRGDRDAALSLFNKAVQIAPDNALVRYRRAKILVSMRKYEPAVKDLEYLRSTSPEESNVIFQLARVYRLLGDEVKSAQTLAIARDISPKSLNKIKKLLETVKDELADDKMDEG
ncbi:TPR-like protein [Pluteus cervinus]|uniref:TPR-like protein n=1 Tax=Pluteus cervinus TaxID=181527 RepID=A0ACD3B3H8_9AGAR|nr:TPR-like protein [Pluteus cervinus]